MCTAEEIYVDDTTSVNMQRELMFPYWYIQITSLTYGSKLDYLKPSFIRCKI